MHIGQFSHERARAEAIVFRTRSRAAPVEESVVGAWMCVVGRIANQSARENL